ncbi:hypothetical protein D3C80_60150 [compost metagenome]
MREVHFISQVEAEKLAPVAGAAMISITDPDKPEAALGGSPLKYEALIQSYETQDAAPTESIYTKIWDLLLVAIGVRR